jgi:secreted Zn-dependent insulinase-like peptidase
MLEAVSKLSDKEFDEQRNSVLTQYSEKDLNLNMEFTRHWVNELSTHKYVWDRQEKECALLKDLTCKEFKQHFKNMFNPKTMRRVDMHWNSKPHKEQEATAAHLVDHYTTSKKEKKHESVYAFKKAMGLYPDVFKANFIRHQHKL